MEHARHGNSIQGLIMTTFVLGAMFGAIIGVMAMAFIASGKSSEEDHS